MPFYRKRLFRESPRNALPGTWDLGTGVRRKMLTAETGPIPGVSEVDGMLLEPQAES